jgi:hypothetical protein
VKTVERHVIFALLPELSSGEVHSTLAYLGKVGENAPPEMALAPVAQMLARFTMPPYGYVMKHDLFGDEMVEVAVLESPLLRSLYGCIEQWANSEWGYSPHISKQDGETLPAVGSVVMFDRIALWYGERRWAWRFGTGAPCSAEPGVRDVLSL